MNTAVALTEILSRTAIILAGIWAGQRFLMALVPQLRIQAPPKAEVGTSSAKDPAAADARTPAAVNGAPARGEST